MGIVSIGNENNDKLLLIRQPRYPKGMYSCIAGFLDAGEAIEVPDVVLFVNVEVSISLKMNFFKADM